MHLPIFIALYLIYLDTVRGAITRRVVPGNHVVHEERSERSKLIKKGRLDSNTTLLVKISLKQPNMNKAEAWLHEVASPESPNFGKFWTSEQVIDAFRPPQSAVDTVLEWLHAAGIHREKVTHSDNKQWLVFDCPTHQAEELFATDFHEYHDLKGRSLAGNDGYHLPRHVSDVVDIVKPGVVTAPLVKRRNAPRSSQAQRRAEQARPSQLDHGLGSITKAPTAESNEILTARAASDCSNETTVTCFSTLLNMPLLDGQPDQTSPKSFGTLQIGQYYEQTDLDLYWKEFFPSRIPQGFAPDFVSINGGLRVEDLVGWQGTFGPEPAQTLETMIPLYYPGIVTNIQVDDEYYAQDRDLALLTGVLDAIDGSYCTSCDSGICGPFDAQLDPIYPDPTPITPIEGPTGAAGGLYYGNYSCGIWKPPAVISSSYYSILGEHDEHSRNHAIRQCNEILKLGLQGITFLFASGDFGVGHGDTCDAFFYSYPNGCPWLLIVGGSMIGAGKTEHDREVVWQSGPAGNQPWKKNVATGSGFSQFFNRPNYQDSAVTGYLKDHDQGYPYWEGLNYNHTKPGYYNRIGRAYPDLAANAGPNPEWLNGTRGFDGGTSISVNVVGVMLARIVDERKKVGKGPIGVPHHVLYSNPQVFKDVISGTNPGCGTQGFPATFGWDPPTGLGVPDYQKLLQLYLSLP